MRLVMLFLILTASLCLGQEDKDFSAALKESGIQGDVQGTYENGVLTITSGTIYAVNDGVKVMVESTNGVTIDGIILTGKGEYSGKELTHGSSSATITVTSVMKSVEMLKDGTFKVVTSGPVVTMQSGTVEKSGNGYLIDSEGPNQLIVSSNIKSVASTGRGYVIGNEDLIFNEAFPQKIDFVDGKYVIDIHGRSYATPGKGVEFMISGVKIPGGATVTSEGVTVKPVTGRLTWYSDIGAYNAVPENEKGNAVVIDGKQIISRVPAKNTEFRIETDDMDYMATNRNGHEELHFKLEKDARHQLERQLSRVDVNEMNYGKFSYSAYELQDYLAGLGFYKGKDDGVYSPQLLASINSYLESRGQQPITSKQTNQLNERFAQISAQTDLWTVSLERVNLPTTTIDEKSIIEEAKVVGRDRNPAISGERKDELDNTFAKKKSLADKQKQDIKNLVTVYYAEYSELDRDEITDHIVAKGMVETASNSYIARIDGREILAEKDAKSNIAALQEIFADNTIYKSPTKDSYGKYQITPQRYADLLLKEGPEYDKLREISAIDAATAKEYRQEKIQLALAGKLLDSRIQESVNLLSTKEYLKDCDYNLNCEAAMHNIGPNTRVIRVRTKEYVRSVSYLRNRLKE